jgi:hypothetical protein
MEQTVALDAVGLAVDDRDAGMGSQEIDQPRSEGPRDVPGVVGEDRERGVEGVVAGGPVLKRGSEEHGQPTAIDGADHPTERVRPAVIVGVDHGHPGRRPE